MGMPGDQFYAGKQMADHNGVALGQVSTGGRAISVLLVDDQPFVAVALGRMLATEHDIALHSCHDAIGAIARANEIGPTVILQDLVLPDIDGLTLVRMFRANPRTAGTPIIVLSGTDDAGIRARALFEGADDYLVKLPARVDLVACIRRHGTATGLRHPRGSSAVSVQETTAPSQNDNETLDRTVIAEFRQFSTPGAEGFTVMIDEFMKDGASQLEHLRAARLCQDLDALRAALHSIKGSSMTMGARRLATLCAQMEGHADRGAGGATMSVLMAELDREFRRVREALAGERQRSPCARGE